jgi:hypothetical protein
VKLAAIVLSLTTACAHGYVSIGYDASKASTGGGMTQVVTEKASTGSVAVGVGGRTTGIELRAQSLDLDPSATGDRFDAASTSFELRLVPLHAGPVALFAHTGPALGFVLDKQMLDVTWGVGFRGGAGAEISIHGVALWIDVAREELTFGGEVVNGRGDRDVVSLGVRVGG